MCAGVTTTFSKAQLVPANAVSKEKLEVVTEQEVASDGVLAAAQASRTTLVTFEVKGC